jgi:hypothetical protein
VQWRVVLQQPMRQVKRQIEHANGVTVFFSAFFTGLGKGEDPMEGGRGASLHKSVEEIIDNHQ